MIIYCIGNRCHRVERHPLRQKLAILAADLVASIFGRYSLGIKELFYLRFSSSSRF